MFGFKKKKEDEKKDNSKSLFSRIHEIFSQNGIKEEFFEALEDLLIESDMGGTATMELVDELRERVKQDKLKTEEETLTALKEIIGESLKVWIPEPDKEINLFLVLGVNGVGKTTTISKMARYYRNKGIDKIVFAAGDTFRAAAIDQLKLHGETHGIRVISQQHGADPGAVIFDSIITAKKHGDQLILADTAGRMHTKKNLVKELEKINKIIAGQMGEGSYYRILVIDATTGQNGLQQAEIFHEAVGIDALVMTKYDSTAKGGLAVAVSRKLGIPVAFLGRGEGLDDLKPFAPEEYLDELFRH